MALDPSSFAALHDLGSHYSRTGWLKEGKESLLKALGVLESSPEEPDEKDLLALYTTLGSTLSLLMEVKEAFKYLTLASELDPEEYFFFFFFFSFFDRLHSTAFLSK